VYSSPNIISVIKLRRKRWAGHVACTRERRGAYSILVGRPLGRPRYVWKDYIKMALQEV